MGSLLAQRDTLGARVLDLEAELMAATAEAPLLLCPACGSTAGFELLGPNVREQLVCRSCGAGARHRHVAHLLCQATGGHSSLRELAGSATTLSLYSAAASGSVFEQLGGRQGCTFSDYVDGVAPGTAIASGVTCQNIEALTYPDEAFDIVVTEDIFEHVRDDGAGFAEIHRILRPGGIHLFTVPIYFHGPTIVRVDTSGPEDIHLMEPEFHGDPLRGLILSYRAYGIDLYERLEKIGFTTVMRPSEYELKDMGIFNSQVLISTKN